MAQSDLSDENASKKDLAAKLSVLQSEEQERLARKRAELFGLEYVNLYTFPIDPDVLIRIPKKESEEVGVILFYKQGKDVRMAAMNPQLPGVQKVVDRVGAELRVTPRVYVISERSFVSALGKYRGEHIEDRPPDDEMRIDQATLGEYAAAAQKLQEMGAQITSLPPTEILTAVVTGAVAMQASDIHVEPKEEMARLRYRLDGVLRDVVEFDLAGWKAIVSRVKALSGLKLNVKDIPQDGSFVLEVGEETYDIRVSVLPGKEGENVVMRLLNRKAQVRTLPELGMKQRDFHLVQRELTRTNGMILMTGPTGSGKTTSLASFITEVNREEIKIITLEDPVEYRLPGVEQTQIDADAGYTFAAGLRSILRQDPDVIMVGEMRDVETAEVAMHAALTGHLVFSTLHTNDAPGALVRLVDMGIAPNIVAPALNVVVAQRLVRKVCVVCAEEYAPDEELVDRILLTMQGVHPSVFDPNSLDSEALRFVRAKGCDACSGTGYKGREGVFEIFSVEGELEELLLVGADTNRIREAALAQGMTTIAQDGFLKVIAKRTTVEEVQRVSEE